MIEQSIRERVQREFMEDHPEVQLTDDTDLISQSIVDSLGLFVLISFIEEDFNLHIDADEVTFENFKSVSAIADLVRAKQLVRSSV